MKESTNKIINKKRATLVLFAIIILVTTVIWRAALAKSEYLTISILDIGQGDAIFIEFPSGVQILVDGGPDAAVLSELSSVMGPYDRTIDIVISTHADADHTGGLIDVLGRYDVKTIIDSGATKDTGLFRTWEDAVRRERATLILADSAKRLRFSESEYIDILWPQRSVVGEEPDDNNEYSVVSRLTYGNFDMLLTGDIDRWGEQRIISSGALSEVEVLKVSHHGSKSSTTSKFLEAISAELAVISVGADNRYGHPTEAVLNRLSEYGVSVLRTDKDGRITIESDGVAFWVVE